MLTASIGITPLNCRGKINYAFIPIEPEIKTSKGLTEKRAGRMA